MKYIHGILIGLLAISLTNCVAVGMGMSGVVSHNQGSIGNIEVGDYCVRTYKPTNTKEDTIIVRSIEDKHVYLQRTDNGKLYKVENKMFKQIYKPIK